MRHACRFAPCLAHKRKEAGYPAPLRRTLGNSAQARRVVVVSDGVLQDSEMSIWLAAHAWNEKSISFSTVHIGDDWSGAAILQEIAGQTQGQFVGTR